MAYENLKTAIKQAIKQNGNQEITGNLLQSTLLNIVNTLGAYYKFLGFASPSTVPPTSEEGRLFYFASAAGEYVNFPITGENAYVVTGEGLYLFTKEANSDYWKADTLVDIVQTTGEAEDKVMSQKAVSDKLSDLNSVAAISFGDTDSDLDIADENGNVLARFSDGHIKTKEFNSRIVPSQDAVDDTDLDISDPQGNVVLRLKGGHIHTKNFSSQNAIGAKVINKDNKNILVFN